MEIKGHGKSNFISEICVVRSPEKLQLELTVLQSDPSVKEMFKDMKEERFDLSTFRSEREYFIDHAKTIVNA
ncbi:hypothetical protein TNCV_664081 [Trichonephila clavipes]|nr:hypothetical protein TNCV_664081 [Trichonephila clavipes]